MAIVPWKFTSPFHDPLALPERAFVLADKRVSVFQHLNRSEEDGTSTGWRLWDGAYLLARWLEVTGAARARAVVELGSGCGLGGLAAAATGAARVLVTDRAELVPGLEKALAANVGAWPEAAVCTAATLVWGAEQRAQHEAALAAVAAARAHNGLLVLGAELVYAPDATDALVWTIGFLLGSADGAAPDARARASDAHEATASMILVYRPRGLGEERFFPAAEASGLLVTPLAVPDALVSDAAAMPETQLLRLTRDRTPLTLSLAGLAVDASSVALVVADEPAAMAAVELFLELVRARGGRVPARTSTDRWLCHQTTVHAASSNDGSRARVPIAFGPAHERLADALALEPAARTALTTGAVVLLARYESRVFVPGLGDDGQGAIVSLYDVAALVVAHSSDGYVRAIQWMLSRAGVCALAESLPVGASWAVVFHAPDALPTPVAAPSDALVGRVLADGATVVRVAGESARVLAPSGTHRWMPLADVLALLGTV